MKRDLLLVAMIAAVSAITVFIVSIRDADINVEETADEPAIDYVGVGA